MIRRFLWTTIYVAFTFLFVLVIFEFGRIAFSYLNSAEKRLFIQVYLKKGLSEREKLEIGKVIIKLAGVERVEYIAGQEAKLDFVRAYPEYQKIIDLFKKVPLPEGYRITVASPFWKPPYIDHLLKEIGMIDGVEEVAFKRVWAHKLARMEKLFDIASILFLILVGVGAFIVSPFIVGYVMTWNTIEIPMFGQPFGAVLLGALFDGGLMWITEKILFGRFPSKDMWSFVLSVAVASALVSEIILRTCLKPLMGAR